MYDGFSEFQEHVTVIFRHFNILKLEDIIKFSVLELIYLYYEDQLPLKIKYNFTTYQADLTNLKKYLRILEQYIDWEHFFIILFLVL